MQFMVKGRPEARKRHAKRMCVFWISYALILLVFGVAFIAYSYWDSEALGHDPRHLRVACRDLGVLLLLVAGPIVGVCLEYRETLRQIEVEFPCPTCGYDLTGNASGTCPECGIPIPAKTLDILKSRGVLKP